MSDANFATETALKAMQTRQAAQDTANPDQPPSGEAPTPLTTNRINKFKSSGETGQELDKKGKPTGETQPRETEPSLTKEVEVLYSEFLINHLSRVALAIEIHPELKTKLKDQHIQELTLLDAFLKEDGSIDEEKIKKYIATEDGKIAITLLIEDLNFKLSAGLGLRPAINPPGERGITVQQISVPLGEQGRLNKVRQGLSSLKERAIKRGIILGSSLGISGGAATGAAIPAYANLSNNEIILGAAAGATAGAVVGAAVGVGIGHVAAKGTEATRDSWNRRNNLEFNFNKDVFDAIQTSDADYFRYVLNFDIEHVQVDATGRLQLKDSAGGGKEPFRSNRNLGQAQDSLQQEVIQLYLARHTFIKSIRAGSIDAGPQQFILARLIDKENTAQAEMIGADYAREVMNRFEELVGGTLDAATLNALPLKDALDKQATAMREVMGRYVAKALEKELAEKAQSSIVTTVETEEEKARRIKAETERKEKLTKEKEELTTRKELHTSYEQQKGGVEKAAEEEITKLHDDLGFSISSPANFESEIRGELTRIDSAIGIDEIVLPEIDANGTVTGKTIGIKGIQAALDYLETYEQILFEHSFNDQYKKLAAGKTLDVKQSSMLSAKAQETATILTSGRIEKLKKKLTDLESRKRRLIESQKRYQESAQQSNKTETEIAAKAPIELNEMAHAHYEVIYNHPHPGRVLNSYDLFTLDADIIIKILSDPHGAYQLPYATDEEKETVRKLAIREKAEEKARRVEEYDSSPPIQTASFNTITTPGASISQNDLLKKTRQELLHILRTDPNYQPGGTYDPAHLAPLLAGRTPEQLLDEAQREARKKLRIRDKAFIEEQEKFIDEEIKSIDKTITEKKEDRDAKKRAGNIVKQRQAKIFAEAYRINPSEKTIINQLTDTNKITNADTIYTQEEIQAGHERGYFEILNLFLGYQQTTDGKASAARGKDFQEFQKALPPDKLAKLLNDSLGLAVTTVDMNNILTTLKTKLTSGAIRSNQLHKAFEQIIDQLKAEGDVA